jgi:hypothetical protein
MLHMMSGGGSFIIWAAVYIYTALAYYTIATKLNYANPWMAWVPFVNCWMMVELAGKEFWWFILFFIPIANLVAAVVITMAIAERVGKPSWWGILILVPFVGLAVPGVLAWG